MTSPRLSEETGRVLGGRYRLVAPVGVGTSSRVFLAVDTQLRRRVAVKLLHEALAEDEAFLRRFRAEARAAGALNHPNIVAVFDWGEDHSEGVVVPYLVTEYLGGGSLRNILDRGEPLSASQTLLVGLETARALAHADLRGLIHRDVKPGNLLFDEDGRLRLADFGLARGLAEASWTEPSGAMVGTARYASPEQALGRRLDGRSDVYSLALVLVECATGQVPFTGETTASTLALRTQGDLELSSSLAGLRSVLERAGRLDPDERPEAAEFEIGLMAAAEELARPEPLPIVRTLGDGEETTELHLVRGLGAVGPAARDPEILADPPPQVLDDLPEPGADVDAVAVAAGLVAAGRLAADAPVQEHDATTDPTESERDTADRVSAGAAALLARDDQPRFADDALDADTAEVERGLLVASRPTSFGKVEPLVPETDTAPRRWPRRLAFVLVLLALVGGAAGWWFFIRVPVHDVPNMVGLDVAAATTEAERLGFTVDTSTVDRRDGSDPGEVLAQSPGADERLSEGEQIDLTVSLGSTLVGFPDVVGAPEADASAALTDAGLTVGTVTRTFDENVAKDAVIAATPAVDRDTVNDQGQIPKGSVIDLSVSDGPAPRAVPAGLVGMSVDEARAALAAVQLGAAVNEVFDETVAPGFITKSNTEAGAELARGAVVTLEMSKGPAPIVVPDVRFVTGSMATQQLEEAGFTVAGIEGSPSGMVLATDPVAGELLPRGTAIRIFTKQ